MARIAIGGFHHETSCFVPTRTDFAFFASHRDRPPLVRGPDVMHWLGDTSFALSGFLKEMGTFSPVLRYRRLRRGVRLYPLGPKF